MIRLKDTLASIKKHIDNKEHSREDIIDNYDIDEYTFDFIEGQNLVFFNLLTSGIHTRIDQLQQKEITKDDIYKEFTGFGMPSSFVDFIFDEIKLDKGCDDNEDNDASQYDDLTDSDEQEMEEEENNDGQIQDKIEEAIKNFKWRENQKKAIDNVIEQDFISGVHSQIMGSGKTNINFKSISEHYRIYEQNYIYPIVCDKIEVLQHMCFNEDGVLDPGDVSFWKGAGIINLEKFHVLNCISGKNIKNIRCDKPTILIINTQSFSKLDTTIQYYENVDKEIEKGENVIIKKVKQLTTINIPKKISFVTIDECHNVSGPEFYQLLRKFKYEYKIHCIGYSATIVRIGSEKNVIDIFSDTLNDNGAKQLNIISSYDMIQAIKDDIILPPHYSLVQIKPSFVKRVGKTNKSIIKKMISDKMKCLPYRKFLLWVKTIDQMKRFYNYFVKEFKSMKIYCSCSMDKKMALHSNSYNTNVDEYYQQEGDAIMVAVNKFKEGSDIPHVDCVGYLDAVKKRGILISLQTAGRVLRPDKEMLKERGYIIDTYVNNDYMSLSVDRIINYYRYIANLAECADNVINTSNYNVIMHLWNNTTYDETTQTMITKVDEDVKHNIEIKLDITTKSFDWAKLFELIGEGLKKLVGVTNNNEFEIVINKLKQSHYFDKYSDFWETYYAVSDELNLPKDFQEKYKDIFEKSTWYEIMGYDISEWYDSINKIKKTIIKLSNKKIGIINKISYNKLLKYDDKLPPNPEYLFNNFWMIINSNKQLYDDY